MSTIGMIDSYLAVMDINCPWVLRYIAIIALTQNKQKNSNLLIRIADIVERCEEPVTDPILLFIYHLVAHIDLVNASKELARCEDVFASDFFLASRGVVFEEVGLTLLSDG